MSDPKECVSCNRNIDRSAKLCPFCTWDQANTPQPRVETPAAAVAAPPQTRREQITTAVRTNRVIWAVGGVALLIIMFVVGSLVHGVEPPEAKNTIPSTTSPTPTASTQTPTPKANIELVPDNGQPITSAPTPTASSDGSLQDATALSSTDYAALAERAKTQVPAPQQPAFVDPRSVGVNGQPAPRRIDSPMASAASPRRAMRTEPIPVYQPVPSLHVGEASTRLYLTVGSDGRVKDIDIARPIPGETPRLIAAVQNWRFRPATENGIPVAARFAVDITFHANE